MKKNKYSVYRQLLVFLLSVAVMLAAGACSQGADKGDAGQTTPENQATTESETTTEEETTKDSENSATESPTTTKSPTTTQAPTTAETTADNKPVFEPLPEGNTGIAAKYPGDEGIGDDPEVLFYDSFESYSYVSELKSKWGVFSHERNMSICTEPSNVFGGEKSLQFNVPKQNQEISVELANYLSESQDVLFFRYYSKFEETFDVAGSSHNGGMISANYYINGAATPGIPADGYNKIFVSYECWRSNNSEPNPGRLNVYVYHPAQRDIWGDHFFPTGMVMPMTSIPFDFGDDFVSRPDVVPELGRWHCYELMVKANTPGEKDGRIACWLDGKLIADFMNLNFREVDTLKLDRYGLSLHIKDNSVSATSKWYDDVVVATSYIGPRTE